MTLRRLQNPSINPTRHDWAVGRASHPARGLPSYDISFFVPALDTLKTPRCGFEPLRNEG